MEQNPFNDVEESQPITDAAAQAKPSNQPASSAPPEEPAPGRPWWVSAIVVALAFGLGFVPMWLKAGRNASERDSVRREMKLLQLETVAAAAVVDARRGEYEPARQSASWFFMALQSELDLGRASSLNLEQQDALKPLLAHRDNIITLLARSDPASEERLTEVYLVCRHALRGGGRIE
jgi:hypothetical protein